MSQATVQLERMDGVALVWLNRPEAYNAFDLPTIGALATRLMDLARDSGVRAVVLGGRGRAFCAGGDLKWVLSQPGSPGAAFHRLAASYHQAITEIRTMPKPVVAAVHGPAAGGGFSLALACDFRVLADTAVLRQAYTSNGLCIDGGGTFTLPRLVGLARALEIAALDRPISAADALAWGLATRVVPADRCLDEALELVREIRGRSSHSFALSKLLLNESFSHSLAEQLELERQGLVAAGEHPHGHEGMTAFTEKRKPDFS
ncbi:MAG: enoyl-CoA hydratase/isomerase family protein [Deltaproteobacteria bacterium]|nr:enoyl-CoA hydratase/isomerase family protein [Deltaproteobacteria bacterium]